MHLDMSSLIRLKQNSAQEPWMNIRIADVAVDITLGSKQNDLAPSYPLRWRTYSTNGLIEFLLLNESVITIISSE